MPGEATGAVVPCNAPNSLRRPAIPGALAVCYSAPIHEHGPEQPCGYESDDPEIRRPDEEAVERLRPAWQRHGFWHPDQGVYTMASD